MAPQRGNAIEAVFLQGSPSLVGEEDWGTPAAAERRWETPPFDLWRTLPGRQTFRGLPGEVHKRFLDPGRSLAQSPAMREAGALQALATLGIRAPAPLLVVRNRQGCLLVMEEIVAARPLPAALLEARGPERRELLRALAELVARLHRAGWRHLDLYLEHILVRSAGEGELVLIDAGRLRRGRGPGDRLQRKDLAAILHSFPRALDPRLLAGALSIYRRALGAPVDLRPARILAQRAHMARHVPRHGAIASRGRHLALRLPNWVGDLVMATPILRAAAEDPSIARISLLVKPSLAPLLAGGPWRKAKIYRVESHRDERMLLGQILPDELLLLNHSLGSALAAWRARVPRRAGLAVGGRGFLLTDALLPPTRGGRRLPVPTAHLQRDVAGLLGLVVSDLRPILGTTAAVRQRVDGLLPAGQEVILAAPGAAKGAGKLWPPKSFAQALAALSRPKGALPVVVGGPGEESIVSAVVEHLPGPHLAFAGRELGLEGLVALVQRSSLLLVGDSGPRWIAAATGTPCVSVMGPNFPELTATSLDLCRVVRLDGLDCSPCLERDCPLGHHRCLVDLPVRAVVAAAQALLAEVSQP